MEHDHDHSEDEELKTIEENPAFMMKIMESFARDLRFATSRKARLEDLMKRHCASKWEPKKKHKMVRRLLAAGQAATNAQTMIDKINVKLRGSDASF